MSRGGGEHVLRAGGYEAVVAEVGASLRSLTREGRDLVLPYARDEVRPRYRGAVLAPWPNRVGDGRYAFAGQEHRLDLSEPERGNALHGLVAWDRFEVVAAESSRVHLVSRLVPRTGYPFDVEVHAEYALTATGLILTLTGRCTGSEAAPWGVSWHPYLVAPGGHVDGWTLDVPAATVLDVTPDRLLPTGTSPVDATACDLRGGRSLAGVELDHALTDLTPDDDGRCRATLVDAGGAGARMTWDPQVLPWVQVHTADLPDPAESRRGLALEPMSCPPDAFRSGTDLVVLAPGAEHVATWTVDALG